MKRSFWTRTKRRMRRALARVRALKLCTRFEKAAPPEVYNPWSPSDKDCHVLGRKFVQTEENVTPDFEFCDLAMTTAAGTTKNWHTDHANHTHQHITLAYRKTVAGKRKQEDADPFANLAAADAAGVLSGKTKFCAFVFENPGCTTRNRFLEILSRSMRVEAGGCTMRSVRHAMKSRWDINYPAGAVEFYRPYKFVLAFENTLSLHYASEKLGTALHAHTVPIYWGNPHMENYFNPERFINAFDFDTLESLARHVMRVHADDALYLRYLSAPARTPRQGAARFTNYRYFVNFPDLQRAFRAERSALFSFYQGLTDKRRKGFLEHYARLMTGRALPLSQRRMFHRECLSRFAHEACGKTVQERWLWEGRTPGRRQISFQHVWPHPAFYEHVDMRGQLDAKAS